MNITFTPEPIPELTIDGDTLSERGDMPPVIYARQKLSGDPHWRWY
jgi:hypothetical protein